jgi:diacylglycerol O-acyltransferase
MHRISGEDAAFFSLELPMQPISILVLIVLRPAVDADGTVVPVTLEYLSRHMADRLDELPGFRWRLQPVPFGLNQPVFIEDPDFVLANHLGEHALPAPGGDDQLDRFCAALAERPLDRRRPLWELSLVNGLADDRQALVLRIHHGLADGVAVLTTLTRILASEEAEPTDRCRERPPASLRWRPEPVPTPSRLLLDALRDHGRAIQRLPALIGRSRRSLSALRASRPSRQVVVPQTGRDAPASSINQAFTIDRRFSHTSLALADVKLVKDAAGVSLNDVALGLVAGSLRSYLEARHDLPTRSLIATVPLGMQEPGDLVRTVGNRFSALTTSLATDIADPWERLQVISAVTAESKRAIALFDPGLLGDWLNYSLPVVVDRLVARYNRQRHANPAKLTVNVVVSNLRGLAPGQSLGSATVEEMYITGPPNNGVGTNITLWDYEDRLCFGILCFADSVAEPRELAEGLHTSLAQLVRLAKARTAGPSEELVAT